MILALAPAGAVQSVTFNSAQIFFAKGRADWAFRWGLVSPGAADSVGALRRALGRGRGGVGYAVRRPVIAPFTLLLTLRPSSMRMRDYLRGARAVRGLHGGRWSWPFSASACRRRRQRPTSCDSLSACRRGHLRSRVDLASHGLTDALAALEGGPHDAPSRSGSRSTTRDLPRDALRSLVSQSHQDLEIIISDNASSDETQRICEEFAAADPRIRYIRQPMNQGGAYNHTYVANLATGDYFRWFAADDVLAPTCIEECVKV